jgi:hypothetical protein
MYSKVIGVSPLLQGDGSYGYTHIIIIKGFFDGCYPGFKVLFDLWDLVSLPQGL